MLTAIVFTLLVAGLIFGAIHLYSRKVNGAWADAADELGLRYRGGGLLSGPTISGEVDSVPVDVVTEPDRANGLTMTRTTVRYPSPGVDFHLAAGSTTGAAATGDATFDGRFAVTSDAPATVDEFLTPERRSALVDLLEAYPSLEVTGTEVTVVTTGTVANVETVVGTVRDLVAVTGVLGDA